jgi:hypothetical protein
MDTDVDTAVRTLLAAMGIAPPADEVDEMIKSYPALRAAADSLYTPEASRYEPVYRATDAAPAAANGDPR